MISIAMEPGVSVAAGVCVARGSSVAAEVGKSVGDKVDLRVGIAVGTDVGVSAAWTAKALAPMGVTVGLAISTGAQRSSCLDMGAPTFFTMDASAGCVTAEYAANPITAQARTMAPTA